jgi:hypothetical protein
MGNIKYTLILIDCDDRTRARRLLEDRQQPELVTDDMMNWARYLRLEAQAHGYEILDTSTLSLHECCVCAGAVTREPHVTDGSPKSYRPQQPYWAKTGCVAAFLARKAKLAMGGMLACREERDPSPF